MTESPSPECSEIATFSGPLPNLAVRVADSYFVKHSINVVAEFFEESRKPNRKILVELDLHRIGGLPSTGKSSSAEAAANAMAA